MEFNKLRLLGFKSFVEPTEFVIEGGLTGVVGPNGCGKSNLVEALRWVMGENSYKNMRASSMDDVIFSGSGNRPARNTAEVALFLDNETRKAPAAFNDADELQVSRRIEREAGSVYRINGRDARAKDVQLLFADVSTGARSPSMIGQGRIGELISAKPQARRALLEEAAGISGLHSRRHEAELRLRAAEANLDRLEDVVAQLESQLESLKRQARQANRYRALAGDIRAAEATLLHLRWVAAKTAAKEADTGFQQTTIAIAEAQLIQTEAAKAQAIIASKLPDLRKAEAGAAAALQRLVIERNQMDEDERRRKRRQSELTARREQLLQDVAREEQMIAENSDIIAHLEREDQQLRGETDGSSAREVDSKAALEKATAALAAGETELAGITQELASIRAHKQQAERNAREGADRKAKLAKQLEDVHRDLEDLNGRIAAESGVQAKSDAVTALEEKLLEAKAALETALAASEEARTAETESRPSVSAAQAEVNRSETEAKTLARVLNAAGGDLFPPIVEKVRADAGYERALGAALGEDLELSTDTSAPAHWTVVSSETDAPLLGGITPLSNHVKAPAELARRLAQIGVVEGEDPGALVADLKPGQRLVTKTGALWRWDGLKVSAEAPTAAAIKLEQRNRLAELDAEAISATKALRAAEAVAREKAEAAKAARENEKTNRDAVRALENELDRARKELANAERAVAELSNRRSALEEASIRLKSSEKEAEDFATAAMEAVSNLPDITILDGKRAVAQTQVDRQRSQVVEARAQFEGQARENAMRADRLAAIEREKKAWNERAVNADRQIKKLKDRLTLTEADLKAAEETPQESERKRFDLNRGIDQAEQARKDAADALAVMENNQKDADRAASAALEGLSQTRQNGARAEERVASARERRLEVEARIREELQCDAHMAFAQTGLEDGATLPAEHAVDARLEKLRKERERLGAVNLRAEEEQREITEQRDELVGERDDLIEAIKQLRQGIQSLNKEGRERLLTAFDEVNAQFQKLFTHLFGGGTAELQLVESDDPLEAGLEILARPPGKKPQTMTLLSGGEQALTAMALIFAVFLTNPAPICVLDEVDAPLDDHNVERFCNLMDEMSANTNTRFVIITHNPITMARMDRLFGVTMAERGVSQLVSVDLQTAESFREAS